jgi:oxygen-independent coproporphyrinogen-3 oxidase
MPNASCEPLQVWLRRQLLANAYPGYVYGYPHKKAYRALSRPVSPAEAWAHEPCEALFCYVHIPFCNQRCSFCNLFTFVPAGKSPTAAYLDALAAEMGAYDRILRPAHFACLYIGGGTPTFLDCPELRRLVQLLRNTLGVDPRQTDSCIEASPETLDEQKVAALRELGFQRLSLGIQSLVPQELRDVNRRFDFALHRRAIDLVANAGFAHFNIDLIYGLPGQSEASWRQSLEGALDSAATSLFLYPLYVRPLTGLDRRADTLTYPSPAQMGAMYDLAVGRLAEAGFRQVTMRQFLRDQADACARNEEHRCQRDGMVGLGAGARSYTRCLHYSTPWKMVSRNIRAVVDSYSEAMLRGDTAIRHGFSLDQDERQRRFVIQSLLYQGLDLNEFSDLFDADAGKVFDPQWQALDAEGCTTRDNSEVRLTARGVRHADVVGQLFFSARVQHLMDSYEYDA